jgi:hypothetical protein
MQTWDDRRREMNAYQQGPSRSWAYDERERQREEQRQMNAQRRNDDYRSLQDLRGRNPGHPNYGRLQQPENDAPGSAPDGELTVYDWQVASDYAGR